VTSRVREPNTFAAGPLDRAAHRRTDAHWLARALEGPAGRAVVATSAGVLVARDRPALVPAASAVAAPGAGEPVFLGLDGDTAVFAVDLDRADDVDDVLRALAPGARLAGLRDVAPALAAPDAGLLAYAAGELNWQRRHRFCSNCGSPTVSAEGGHLRTCPRCGATHHPRTDPVVIMLVHDGDRVLLGRQAAWPQRRYSALAGFVEPGESLEEAVAREVAEESGVAVTDVRYCSSQPWPFPVSLMLGFRARWAGGEPATHDDELEDVRWFSREQVRERRDGLRLPPRQAIARRLIDEWLARDVPQAGR
jgi:NAD+ diphosphatase